MSRYQGRTIRSRSQIRIETKTGYYIWWRLNVTSMDSALLLECLICSSDNSKPLYVDVIFPAVDRNSSGYTGPITLAFLKDG